MKKNRVYFITPEDKFISLSYGEVNNFCKELCEGEYREEFEIFKKDYTYFTPYFDFCMFFLKYIFVNPLFLSNKCLCPIDEALYLGELTSFSYDENMEEVKSTLNYSTANPLPFITKVTNKELDLKLQSGDATDDCLIDINLMGMMSKTGTVAGSHGITAASILNQLVLLSPIIEESYYKYTKYQGIDYLVDPLNFLVSTLGFIRATSPETYPMLIGNENLFSKQQLNLVETCKNGQYRFFSVNQEGLQLVDEYKRLIK